MEQEASSESSGPSSAHVRSERTDERLRQALDACGIGLWDLDLLTRRVTASPACRELLGLSHAIDPGLEDIAAALDPEHRDAFLAAVAVAGDAHGPGVLDAEHRAIRPDGTARWVRLRGRHFAASAARGASLFGTAVDVTARRATEAALQRSEERHRLIARATSEVIRDWDLVTNEVVWNEATHAVLGYSEDMLQSSPDWWYDHLHPDDRDRVARGMRAAIDAGASTWTDEYRFRHADGRFCTIHDRAWVAHDRNGLAVRVAASMVDVTVRRRVEEERESLLERERATSRALETAVRARDEVLAVVSHDLRNPLNAIMTSASMLRDLPLPDVERDRQLALVQRAAHRMNDLIQDLLDVSRMEAGHFSVEPEAVALDEVVADVCDQFRPLAAEKGVVLRRADGAAVETLIDRRRTVQALSNLLANALRFTPRGGVIRIGLDAEGDTARVSVTDSGPGIPEEDRPRLFDRFWQKKRAPHEGAGLGLTIARGIAEAHGGTIEVASRVGEGSTFTLVLPLRA